MSDDRQDVIRARAYQLWEDEGRPEGREEMHWRQASRDMEEATDEAASITEPAVTAMETEAPAPAEEPRPGKPKAGTDTKNGSAPAKVAKLRKSKVAN